jgi:hypothetical protein
VARQLFNATILMLKLMENKVEHTQDAIEELDRKAAALLPPRGETAETAGEAAAVGRVRAEGMAGEEASHRAVAAALSCLTASVDKLAGKVEAVDEQLAAQRSELAQQSADLRLLRLHHTAEIEKLHVQLAARHAVTHTAAGRAAGSSPRAGLWRAKTSRGAAPPEPALGSGQVVFRNALDSLLPQPAAGEAPQAEGDESAVNPEATSRHPPLPSRPIPPLDADAARTALARTCPPPPLHPVSAHDESSAAAAGAASRDRRARGELRAPRERHGLRGDILLSEGGSGLVFPAAVSTAALPPAAPPLRPCSRHAR